MKNEQNNNQSTKPKKTTAVYFLNIKNKKNDLIFILIIIDFIINVEEKFGDSSWSKQKQEGNFSRAMNHTRKKLVVIISQSK